MNLTNIIEYIKYLWPFRKTKLGLFLILLPITLWWLYNTPKYFTNHQEFYVISITFIIISVLVLLLWLCHSGRIILRKRPFNVAICIEPSDSKSLHYITRSIKVLNRELDKLNLLSKIRIKQIGHDIINNREQATAYRERLDVDLIIWGDVSSGSKDEKSVCDFKNMFFTYRVPKNLIRFNLSDIFKNDINIALVNRDWNVYEINSLPDTEKISAHLSEIILFILGIIYAQYLNFAEDSGTILECLFNQLDDNTRNEKITIDDTNQCIKMSPAMLRKGRVQAQLHTLYKNLGIYLVEIREFSRGKFYLDKCMGYGKKDIDILSSAAVAAFYLKDIPMAKTFTDEINVIEKNHQIYTLNRAFFGIYETNYSSALFYYKDILKRGRNVDKSVIIKVIAFLDERKSENVKEIAYDFAIGVLSLFLSRKQAERDLRQFIKAAKRQDKYSELVCFVQNEIVPHKKNRKK